MRKNNTNVAAIRSKYNSVNKEWLRVHFIITLVLLVLASLVEVGLGYYILNTDLRTTSVTRFILKYMVAPIGANFLIVLVDYIFLFKVKLLEKYRPYVASVSFVLICFVLFNAHSTFTVTLYMFSFSIYLTVVYADKILTGVTLFLSAFLMILSEFYIFWDPNRTSTLLNPVRFGDFIAALSILGAIGIISLMTLEYELQKTNASIELEIERVRLQNRLKRDELTGLLNKNALHDEMREISETMENHSYVFAILDLDFFKEINDTYGHQVGDKYLVMFADLLKALPDTIKAFRFGGDEFCLVIRDMQEDAILDQLKILKNNVAALRHDTFEVKISLSVGIAHLDEGINSAELFVRADQAMYKAKEVRNSIVDFKNMEGLVFPF